MCFNKSNQNPSDPHNPPCACNKQHTGDNLPPAKMPFPENAASQQQEQVPEPQNNGSQPEGQAPEPQTEDGLTAHDQTPIDPTEKDPPADAKSSQKKQKQDKPKPKSKSKEAKENQPSPKGKKAKPKQKPQLPINKPKKPRKKPPKNLAKSLYNAMQAQNDADSQDNVPKYRSWTIRMDHILPPDPRRLIKAIARYATLCVDGFPFMVKITPHVTDQIRNSIQKAMNRAPSRRNAPIPSVFIKKASLQCVSPGVIEACVILLVFGRFRAVSMRIQTLRGGVGQWRVVFLQVI